MSSPTQVQSYLDRQKNILPKMYDQSEPTRSIESENINPFGFAKLWNTPIVKAQLRDSIQQKMSQGKLPQHKSINEKMLMTEYWRQWLNIDEKDFTNQLQKHPGLTVKDHEDITYLVTQERARQFYYSCGMSVFSYGIYHLALKKKASFYNFFKTKSKYRVVNFGKTFMGGFMLVWTWVIVLNYFYDQKIPTDLAKKGYYKDYKIMFEQVYV